MEAMIFARNVHKIMQEHVNITVTCSSDGSSMNGAGNYVVQSFNTNGKQRALPTLSIFIESRKNLKGFFKKLFTLKMFSAACGGQHSEKDILQKIDFIMTDSTADDLTVTQNVCQELG